jgi:uncharacterized membrane protein YdjX (TVP38/TMEM64 family)
MTTLAASGWKTGRARAVRLGLVGVLFAALLVYGHVSGIAHGLTAARLRELVVDAGTWGMLLFVLLFAVGQLAHLPGLLFIVAGILAYGRFWGAGLGWIGALASVSLTFAVARGVGGSPLAEIENPRIRKILARLDSHPISTVLVLRLFLTTSPPVNYSLALSGVRYRHYLLGSAVGLVPVIVLASVFLDRLMS